MLVLFIRHGQVIHLTWEELLQVASYPVLFLTEFGWQQAWGLPTKIRKYLIKNFPHFLDDFEQRNFSIISSPTLRPVQTSLPLSIISGIKISIMDEFRAVDIVDTYNISHTLKEHFDGGRKWPESWERTPKSGLEIFQQFDWRIQRGINKVINAPGPNLRFVVSHAETVWPAECFFKETKFTAKACDLELPFCHIQGFLI